MTNQDYYSKRIQVLRERIDRDTDELKTYLENRKKEREIREL